MKQFEERVREYARALINHHGIYYMEGDTSELSAEFGQSYNEVADKFQKKKKAKKKKANKKPRVRMSEELAASIHGGAYSVSSEQLAELAKEAEQALQAASKQAGEPLAYCCGKLKPEGEVGSNGCVCRDSLRHQIINGWQDEVNNK